MQADRWKQIGDLFEALRHHPADSRAELLQQACPDDPGLRAQVDLLLKAADTHDPVLDGSPLSFFAESGTALKPGDKLGHFQIAALLGRGGMGEVYRARDLRLQRDAALKTLPSGFAANQDRVARFEREAKVLAALNHPNIAQIYGVEGRALILELVEGEIPSGPLPVETALDYAKQIAEALEYAHERGVIHRDLKPNNVKVTSEGIVKLLDFGLAKAIEGPATPGDDPTRSPAPTSAASSVGIILGTAAYMSPEQARGKMADRRADIWSFGAVLYEMLSGERAFEGETVSDTLAAVLTADADWSALPAETPASVRKLIERCLTKDRRQRLQSIGEARIVLEAALSGDTPSIDERAAQREYPRRWLPWSIAAVLAMSLAAVTITQFRKKPPVRPASARFQIELPENVTAGPLVSMSPDGRKVAFLSGDRLWVHFLQSGESRDLAAGEGRVPFWSPDSRFIAYPSEGRLKKIEASGGTPQVIADLAVRSWGGGAWNQDDFIIFANVDLGLFRVPASGGVAVQITALDRARHEYSQCCPSLLPDGQHFFYTRESSNPDKEAIYLGSVYTKPEQQSFQPVIDSHWQGSYAPSVDPRMGYLLFMREGSLMTQPFDQRRLALTGQATPIAERVSDNAGGTSGHGAFSAGHDALVFLRSTPPDREITVYDQAGKAFGKVGKPEDYHDLALSPDGTRLAVSRKIGRSTNIWLLDLSKPGESTRFTFGSASDTNPVWSPDGSSIIFSSNRDGPYNLYQKQVNGLKDEAVLLKSSEDNRAASWSSDGRFLLFINAQGGKEGSEDIWVLPLRGNKKPAPFVSGEPYARRARFSPDGRWVAYSAWESGQFEVYVRSFSMSSDGTAVQAGAKWQISDGFGTDPHWRANGREIYYCSRYGALMAVEIATEPAFRAGKPRPIALVPDMKGLRSKGFFDSLWDTFAYGQRFIGAMPPVRKPEPYTVVLNWQSDLKK